MMTQMTPKNTHCWVCVSLPSLIFSINHILTALHLIKSQSGIRKLIRSFYHIEDIPTSHSSDYTHHKSTFSETYIHAVKTQLNFPKTEHPILLFGINLNPPRGINIASIWSNTANVSVLVTHTKLFSSVIKRSCLLTLQTFEIWWCNSLMNQVCCELQTYSSSAGILYALVLPYKFPEKI